MTTRNATLLFMIAAVFSAGCDGGPMPAAGSAPPASTGTPSPAPKTTSVGDASATAGALPADFPQDVPVYKGATVVSAASQGGSNYGALLSTGDATGDVATFYTSELKKAGWSEPTVMNAGGSTVMSAKKDKRQCAVSLSKGADGKTSISIGISSLQ